MRSRHCTPQVSGDSQVGNNINIASTTMGASTMGLAGVVLGSIGTLTHMSPRSAMVRHA